MIHDAVSYLIADLRLALAPVGQGLLLVSGLERPPAGWEDAIQPYREAIVAELQRRLVTFKPCAPDSVAARIQPALERLQEANLWVLKTGRNVKRLEWITRVGIVDDQANHHPHPIGCLPEVLWWIDRMFPADTALLHWGHNESKKQAGGGCA